eukprot:CAMPEP_0180414658 /NCGR_PEP_ID=MMETSP0989-20121125/45752_1 /TAXON_ID=697907 /ORGANISM="non described non described, Strain CCMP2293" /LENGTH=128 /DNA_ID=CAMNT_0022419327 /DNA_START=45 /DNA_END=428 /DNA_ORIENTATION=+
MVIVEHDVTWRRQSAGSRMRTASPRSTAPRLTVTARQTLADRNPTVCGDKRWLGMRRRPGGCALRTPGRRARIASLSPAQQRRGPPCAPASPRHPHSPAAQGAPGRGRKSTESGGAAGAPRLFIAGIA